MSHILLIGCGAREHAIAKKLCLHENDIQLTVVGNYINPGIHQLARHYHIFDCNDTAQMHTLLNTHTFDFAIVGPEAPLAAGLSDYFWEHNVPCIGPKRLLAQIETSKHFCRQLVASFNTDILPAFYKITSIEEAESFLSSPYDDYVIKADGLMGGKGVYIKGEHYANNEQALDICQSLLTKGSDIVLEEQLFGDEFSLLSFSDGHTLKHMPLVQDNKRAYENDSGPNTGGMGSISYANHQMPFLTAEEIALCQKVNEQTVQALQEKYGLSYQGILYGSFIKTAQGIKLIEYNARFGDPEAINLLPLLQTDFLKLCTAIVNQTLSEVRVDFKNKASVCKYVVPLGYPNNAVKGEKIVFDDQHQAIFHASIDEQYQLLGSRAIACLGIADDMKQAEQYSEELASGIIGPVFHRKDIGTYGQLNKNHQKKLAILGSTNGTSFKGLLPLLSASELPCSVEMVVSNRACGLIQFAQDSHLRAYQLEYKQFEPLLEKQLTNHKIDFIVLIGFMKILSPDFTKRWKNRIINIHPSLLPKHKGLMNLAVHQAVLSQHEKQTGCTVHYVTEEVDAGPIVCQKTINVLPGDTAETLQKRVQSIEPLALLEAITMIIGETNV